MECCFAKEKRLNDSAKDLIFLWLSYCSTKGLHPTWLLKEELLCFPHSTVLQRTLDSCPEVMSITVCTEASLKIRLFNVMKYFYQTACFSEVFILTWITADQSDNRRENLFISGQLFKEVDENSATWWLRWRQMYNWIYVLLNQRVLTFASLWGCKHFLLKLCSLQTFPRHGLFHAYMKVFFIISFPICIRTSMWVTLAIYRPFSRGTAWIFSLCHNSLQLTHLKVKKKKRLASVALHVSFLQLQAIQKFWFYYISEDM